MRVQKDAFTLPLPETFSLDPVHHCCVVVTVGSGEAVQCSGILIVSPGMALVARTIAVATVIRGIGGGGVDICL